MIRHLHERRNLLSNVRSEHVRQALKTLLFVPSSFFPYLQFHLLVIICLNLCAPLPMPDTGIRGLSEKRRAPKGLKLKTTKILP